MGGFERALVGLLPVVSNSNVSLMGCELGHRSSVASFVDEGCDALRRSAILRRHLVDKVSVADLCDEDKLQPSVLYQWLNNVFDNLPAALEWAARVVGAQSSLFEKAPPPMRAYPRAPNRVTRDIDDLRRIPSLRLAQVPPVPSVRRASVCLQLIELTRVR